MHKATKRFWKSFEDLPEQVQHIARKNFRLLQNNPSHPSLHFKKIGDFWSARVGLEFRALAVKVEEDFIWVWIGSHKDYEQLLKRREKWSACSGRRKESKRKEESGPPASTERRGQLGRWLVGLYPLSLILYPSWGCWVFWWEGPGPVSGLRIPVSVSPPPEPWRVHYKRVFPDMYSLILIYF